MIDLNNIHRIEFSDLQWKLIDLIIEKGFYTSDFTFNFILSSGERSDYYVDCKKVSLTKEGYNIIGELLSRTIKDNIDLVGGPSFGAIPLVLSVLGTTSNVDSFIVRSKRKEYGAEKEIEGEIEQGDNICIIDDVVTTGNSLIECIEKVRDSGGIIGQVIVVVDRMINIDRENFISYLESRDVYTPLIDIATVKDRYLL